MNYDRFGYAIPESEEDELYHHGIKGQKWGIRRFQPYGKGKKGKEVGEAAKTKKKRIASNVAKAGTIVGAAAAGLALAAKKPSALDANIKQGKDKPSISPAEKTTKELSNITTNVNKIATYQKRSMEDLTNYSDDEIRKMINRMQLEKQYNELKDYELNRGMEPVNEILTTIGSAVAITGSALAIATAVKGLKG